MTKPGLKQTLILLILPAAVFLQATLLANSLPGGVTPNLGFLLTVAAGFLGGAAAGACSGMWAGALTGAASGALAAPFACLYGFVGWLAGLHAEKKPRLWTLPLTGLALAAILLSGENLLAQWIENQQAPLSFKFFSLFWMGLASFVFLLRKGVKKTKP